MPTNDLERLRNEYQRRDNDTSLSSKYSCFDLANLFLIQQRQRVLVKLLKAAGLPDLAGRNTLEIGCGSGAVLCEYLAIGADGSHLFGIDLILSRLKSAQKRLPGLRFTCADGGRLPFKDRSFDLVLQYTVFSSILDLDLRRVIATEMLRVLKPAGLILWYDFWFNPMNPQTRGLRLAEVKSLFPTCDCRFRRITLAPPISRVLAPRSWLLCQLLERFKILNTHYLGIIRDVNRTRSHVEAV